jgi:hypothetical protein
LVTSAHHDLAPDEQRLVGAWVERDGRRELDDVDRRIFWLVTRRLVPRGIVHAGWEQLYQDPRDGRFWELTFPEGSLHGGGPRRLECVAALFAREKYGVEAS